MTLQDTRADVEDHDGGEASRFDRARQAIGFFGAPIAFVVLLLIPMPLETNQQQLAALMVFVFLLWITEAVPLPVSSMLALGLAVVLQVPTLEEGQTASGIVYSAFSSSTIFLVIGGFILSRAMSVHDLDRRFALRVLSIPGVTRSTARVAVAFGMIAALISAFVSNSAAAAMLLPIGIGIVREIGPTVAQAAGVKHASQTRFATMTMLMIAYGASVGGLLTPVGSTANVVGLGFLERQVGVQVGFAEWVPLTAPLVVVLFVVMCLVLYTLNKPETKKLPGAEAYVRAERESLGAWSRGEKNTLVAFLVAVVLWMAPGLLADSGIGAGTIDWFTSIDIGTAAVLASCLLFVLPISWQERTFTLTWRQAVDIDWGTVLLVGTGLVLGTLMDNTGLATVVGDGVVSSLGISSGPAVIILSVAFAVIISEMASNTAAVGVVAPVVIPIAAAVGMDPTMPVLAAIFGASCGFLLPVSTPPNAIVYGSGMVPITKMARTGVVFDILAIGVVSAGVLVMSTFITVS